MTSFFHATLFLQARQETAGWYQILLFVGFIAITYFLILRPSMKQQKEQRKLVDTVKVGDKIITNGGIYGEIDAVEKDRVRLIISEKTKIYIARTAIHGKQPEANKAEK
jgi:preprotein translocase subunit YajC